MLIYNSVKRECFVVEQRDARFVNERCGRLIYWRDMNCAQAVTLFDG